jgi:site-specific DNA-cytosine methylase
MLLRVATFVSTQPVLVVARNEVARIGGPVFGVRFRPQILGQRVETDCMHKRTNTNRQTHKRTNIQTRKRINTQTRKHTHTQTHKHTNAQTHKHTNAETCKHTNTQTHKTQTHDRANSKFRIHRVRPHSTWIFQTRAPHNGASGRRVRQPAPPDGSRLLWQPGPSRCESLKLYYAPQTLAP